MAKIFITGITGLVGGAFAAALLRAKPETKFIALTRKTNGASPRTRVEEAIREQCQFDGYPEFAEQAMQAIEVVEGDISQQSSVQELAASVGEVDLIFHCAADVNLGKDPEGKTFINNLEGTRHILELADVVKAKEFHYVSTAYVAGKFIGVSPEDGLVADDWHNSYEKSKFQAETLVRSGRLPFAIYRPSIVVGRLSDGLIRKPLAFYRILEFLAKFRSHYCHKQKLDPSQPVDMPLRLQAHPSEKVYFVPIDYVQRTLVQLFDQPVENHTYHLTGNTPVSTKSIERVVANTLGVNGVTVEEEVINPTMDEKLVQRFLGDLLPYFSSDATFDVANVQKALGEDSIDWHIDDETLTVLIGNFFKSLQAS